MGKEEEDGEKHGAGGGREGKEEWEREQGREGKIKRNISVHCPKTEKTDTPD